MARAFISHSSAQGELIKRIGKKIGLDNCVIDKYHFSSGEPILSEIIKGIESTDLFVLCLSNEALNSDWIKREIEHAYSTNYSEFLNRILVINLDPTISYTDSRLPNWIPKSFDLKPITDEIWIVKKIESKLRDISIENDPKIKKKEEIYVGRNDLMNDFERRFHQLNGKKPTCIIVSGLENVGRRTFIRNALDVKAKLLNKFHENISITLDTRDSIEDFIIRIEEYNSKNIDEITKYLCEIDMEAKLNYAIDLLRNFKSNREILFVIDRGCIIQPNRDVAIWFNRVIQFQEFDNSVTVCIISKFRLSSSKILRDKKYQSFHVPELGLQDTSVLFSRYCSEVFEIKPPEEISKKILECTSGNPGQIYFAADLLFCEGPALVERKLDEIRKYNDIHVYSIIRYIEEKGNLYRNVLIFLARTLFVSYRILYGVFKRTPELDDCIDNLYAYGVYNRIGAFKENMQVNTGIAEYINRANMQLDPIIKSKLKKFVYERIGEKLDFPDVSEILISLKELVEEKVRIPSNLMIPSYILRTIIESYYSKNYEEVEYLAERILDAKNQYDPSIVREIRYWLCLSLIRQGHRSPEKNDKFFNHLEFFKGADYNFLKGFHFRLIGQMPKAETCFRKVLEFEPDSQKAKRELVNVLLSLGKVEMAYEMAESNYHKKPLNAFHCQAYFICITRKPFLNRKDRMTLNEIMNSVKMSHDMQATDILKCMSGEYLFYAEGKLEEAIRILTEVKDESRNNYPKRALLDIFKKRGFRQQAENIKREITSNFSLIDSNDDY